MTKWFRLEFDLFSGERKIIWVNNFTDAYVKFIGEFEDEIDVNVARLYEFEYEGEPSAEGGKLIRKYWRAEP